MSNLLNVMLGCFRTLIRQKEALLRRGIGIKVVGKLDMLPLDLQMVARELMEATENCRANISLNIALAYTSREEITNVSLMKLDIL